MRTLMVQLRTALYHPSPLRGDISKSMQFNSITPLLLRLFSPHRGDRSNFMCFTSITPVHWGSHWGSSPHWGDISKSMQFNSFTPVHWGSYWGSFTIWDFTNSPPIHNVRVAHIADTHKLEK